MMNNGTRKGGQPEAMKVLHSAPGVEDIWQLHFSQLSGQEYTVPGDVHRQPRRRAAGRRCRLRRSPPPPRGAGPAAARAQRPCASGSRCRRSDDGTFTVTNARNGFSKTYAAVSPYQQRCRSMPRSSLLFLCAALISSVSSAQPGANVPADTALSVVAYVEARADAAETARATLKRYREASRRRIASSCSSKSAGRVISLSSRRGATRLRSTRAMTRRTAAARRLEAIRVSGYDQRLYKTLTTAPAVPSTDSGTVLSLRT